MLIRLWAMSSAAVQLNNDIIFTYGEYGETARCAVLLAKALGKHTSIVGNAWSEQRQVCVELDTKHSKEAKAFLDLLAEEYPKYCGCYVDKELTFNQYQLARRRAADMFKAISQATIKKILPIGA